MAMSMCETSAVSRTIETCAYALCGVGYSATKVPPRVASAPNLGCVRKTCQKKLCCSGCFAESAKNGKLCGNLAPMFSKIKIKREAPQPPSRSGHPNCILCNILGEAKACIDAVSAPKPALVCCNSNRRPLGNPEFHSPRNSTIQAPVGIAFPQSLLLFDGQTFARTQNARYT